MVTLTVFVSLRVIDVVTVPEKDGYKELDGSGVNDGDKEPVAETDGVPVDEGEFVGFSVNEGEWLDVPDTEGEAVTEGVNDVESLLLGVTVSVTEDDVKELSDADGVSDVLQEANAEELTDEDDDIDTDTVADTDAEFIGVSEPEVLPVSDTVG